MIKESRNLTSVAKLFALHGDDTARIVKEIGKKNTARFKSMFDRNLAAAQAGKPYDQTFMDIMYPRVERMFANNQLPTRDFRRIYNKSKLFDTAKATILARNDALFTSGAHFTPKRFSRTEQREGLQYVRGLRNSTDLSKKFLIRLEQLDDAIRDSQRYVNNAHLSKGHGRYAGPDTTSFAKSQGFLSREDLLRQAKKENIILNKNDLHEPFYVNKGTALESSQAIPKSPWIRSIDSTVNAEINFITNANSAAKQILQRVPRSIQRAAAIVDGQNVLQHGTKANRLVMRMQQSNSPGIKKLLSSELDTAVRGENAFYTSMGNYIAVNPKIPFKFRNKTLFDPVAVEAHERGHFFAHNLPEAEHRAIANILFTKLKRAAVKYNLNIPFDDFLSMQEAFADGYAALKLGKLQPFDKRLNLALYNAKLNKMNPSIYRSDIRNLKKINNATDLDDVTKQMLNQLQVNYKADIFKNWR